MLTISDFLADRPQDEHLALANAVGEGLHQARLAAQCLTDDDLQHHTVVQLLAYLSPSIERLQAARAMVQRTQCAERPHPWTAPRTRPSPTSRPTSTPPARSAAPSSPTPTPGSTSTPTPGPRSTSSMRPSPRRAAPDTNPYA
jgi:hypothetical protein